MQDVAANKHINKSCFTHCPVVIATFLAFQIAALAQSVEHIIRNDGVVGSNPISGTSFSI
jgi:hypothetical protein